MRSLNGKKDILHITRKLFIMSNVLLHHPSYLCMIVICMADMIQLIWYINYINVVVRNLVVTSRNRRVEGHLPLSD